MKLEFQAKFLQHLNKKKQDEGFTLIELLVVIIIIGILAAIALPSLLGQVNKAKQAEAKNNIGVLNRAQQAYILEYQQFETTVRALGVGIKTETENYKYDIVQNPGSSLVVNRATAKKQALKSYLGIVQTTVGDAATGEVLSLAQACESKSPTSAIYAAASSLTSTECPPADYKALGK